MFLTILIFIVILGVLIFVHEFGHFLMAKRSGVRVDEFGFGFPPRLVGIKKEVFEKTEMIEEKEERIDLLVGSQNPQTSQEIFSQTDIIEQEKIKQVSLFKKWRLVWGKSKKEKDEKPDGNTLYSLNLIPLGGFVKIYGEEGEGEKEKNSFSSKKIWQKAVILLAGVVMNFILAAVLFSVGHFLGLPTALSDEEAADFPEAKVEIVGLSQNSPAQEAGLKMGDSVIALVNLEGQRLEPVNNISQFVQFTEQEKGRKVSLIFQRGGQRMETKLLARAEPPENEGPLGVELANVAKIRYPWYRALFKGVSMAFGMLWLIILTFFEIVRNLIIQGRAGVEIAGPVGIFSFTGQAANLGFIYLLQLTAVLSINLAVINALPFPALDGGRILFLAIEKIKGSPVSQKVQGLVHAIGFSLLIILMILVTYKDVVRLL